MPYLEHMHTNFPTQIYDEVKGLFPEDTQAMYLPITLRPELAEIDPVAQIDPAVRLIHTPTGIEVICEEFPSQTENYVVAAIRLRIACDKRAA